jgi:hypothetical protein
MHENEHLIEDVMSDDDGADQGERISALEFQMNSVLEHIIALENNVGSIAVTS